ncbi:polyprotein [Cucumis melo var. makuwa]|uniref:Polyprotein n=1 Tax=Cucumis melo var. makuwa TaxID=1194695 RepID=A0A5A7THR3_CUCMM|nr:polyprotein [Cucumis melo var. makuwa]
MVTLPYEDGFKEAQIPTKARPIQMNKDLVKVYKDEITYLLKRGLISPSKSLWSCSAFYVNNQVEKERGIQRLVINYKPLNKVLKWIRLKKNPKSWTDEHTRAVQSIKSLAKSIPSLSLVDEQAKLIIDTDASDIGYGGILKQELNEKISIVRYHSGIWNSAQKNYSTVKKEVLAIVLSVQKFQGDLINKEFLVRTDSKASKFIFEKDVKNLISKQIFARWQTILSCFDFKIEPIKGSENSLADYLSREHLLKTTSSALNPQPNGTASWPATTTEPAATAAKQSK